MVPGIGGGWEVLLWEERFFVLFWNLGKKAKLFG